MPAPAPHPSSQHATEFDRLYQSVKERLMEECPALIKVMAERPEIVVTVERTTIEVEGDSVKGRVAKLLANGWFKGAQRHADIKRELERTGTQINNKSLSVVLGELVKLGFLTDEGTSGYKPVDGMKARIVEKK